ENSWIEMEDWPLADYEELLSLTQHPVSGVLDLVVTKPVQFLSGLAQNVWGFLARAPSKVSPTQLFGGGEPRKLWELLTSRAPKNYHLLFDTTTAEGLKHAIETRYIVKDNDKMPAVLTTRRLPIVNISPLLLAFLAFHEQYQDRPFYKTYVKNSPFNADVASLPFYHVDRERGYVYLAEAAAEGNILLPGQAGNLQDLLNVLEAMRVRKGGAAILKQWGQDYIAYLEVVMVKIRKTVALNEAELAEQKQRFADNSAVLNELRATLEVSQSELTQLTKELSELKALQQEAANQKGSGGSLSLIMDSAVAEEKGGKAENEIRMSEKTYLEDKTKDRELFNAQQERVIKHPGYVPPKNQKFVFNAAVVEKRNAEAKNKIILSNNTNTPVIYPIDNPLSKMPSPRQSDNQPSFFQKEKGIKMDEEGGLFKVKLNYGVLKLSVVQRQELQRVLNDDSCGVGAFGYVESSAITQSNCIVQLDFEDKEAALTLVEMLNQTLAKFKQPVPSAVSSSFQEHLNNPK
ncbi:MAG: hypothetical protein K2Q14_08480, partial [Gammaproteobacteria bacterium]|nr:hypothetical protein [Gammaproteobacteria bacterium]